MNYMLRKLNEIDDPNGIPKKSLQENLTILLTYAGILLFCVLGFSQYDKNVLMSYTETVTAVVSKPVVLLADMKSGGKIKTVCHSSLSYSINGKDYNEDYNKSSQYNLCDIQQGDNFKIVYNVDNPKEFITLDTKEEEEKFNSNVSNIAYYSIFVYSFLVFCLLLHIVTKNRKA